MAKKIISGKKGGSTSSRTPVEQPDDLQSVAKEKILLALGEGEFAGELTGQNIFLDGTPLLNADGSSNFSGVNWDFRSGTQDQTYIQGLPGTENEISVGTTITETSGFTRTFTDSTLSAIRLRIQWPSLFEQEDNGDLNGYSIAYNIAVSTDGGAFQTVIDTAVTGKTTTGYERSHRVDLPQDGSTWTVRLTRTTAVQNSARFGDTMTLESYTEVIDAKLRYPNTALLYMEFDSSQFSGNVPQITCEPKGRMIRVPDNYDPDSRTYTGEWDGTFKIAWTDNPAWVFYDLVVTDRFGLGDRLTADNIDKWTLYTVAQYCDELVPDGLGGSGTEPRFKCDVYVQNRSDAYTVFRDFAAIFRGMTYWSGDQIVALADMPRDVDYNYTNANVIDGQFAYSSSNTKTRYTSALVSYSDPDNGYANAVQPVFEPDLVTRYKTFNQLELTAIACTRQSEADRRGRWGILTNSQDRIVTFQVGLDGDIPLPGYIIAVADEYLSGRVAGGRISSVNGRVITLDRTPDALEGDRLQLNLPSGTSEARTIESIAENIVTVSVAYSETPEAESVWVVESTEVLAQLYRVSMISIDDDGNFSITGSAYDPSKYDAIDNGAQLDSRPISVIPAGTQNAPQNIVIDEYSVVNQGISLQTMRVQWDPTPNALAYEAQWRRNSSNWINVPRTSTISFEVPAIYTGTYQVRVRAINAAEISSGWSTSALTELTGKVGNPPLPVGFSATTNVVWGITLSWGFPDNTEDTLKTTIQYATNAEGTDATLLSDVAYPSHVYVMQGLLAGQGFWFRAQLVDKTGNQSGFTDWIHGEASENIPDIIGDISKQIEDSPAFQGINRDLSSNAAAILENALANNATVNRQYAQYGEVKAEILTVSTTIADTNQALADLETQLTAEIGETQALIDEKLTANVTDDGTASATFALEVGVTRSGTFYSGGMAIGIAPNASGSYVSTVVFDADQFGIYSGGTPGNYQLAFSVFNGQTFINQAFIQDASITNAKIGDFIQSNNYVSGSTGWSINKNGGAEFSNVTIRGTVIATTGQLSNVVVDSTCTVQSLRAENIQGDLLIASEFANNKVIGARNNPNAIVQNQLYPIVSFSGAPFVRRLTFTNLVNFIQSQRNVIQLVTTTGVVVDSFDTGNPPSGGNTIPRSISVSIPATSYDVTEVLYVRWTSRGGAFEADFNGNVFVFKSSSAITWDI
ncbi:MULTISPECIES: host specificity protein J [Pantoea]|uniref:Phage-related protein, tail component n=1 Tax=Candidatus Pantoea floridensis TaxID=1938870 RepID=A0A286BZV1_9GAMM|nr:MULTISPECIES: phage tail protein [Pantoea]PIF22166.1 putative phage tail protein [Enterobacteriaceae bacterium JKS000233]PXW18550.1 putative phage tail protein [Pantoea sp. JKS000250]SOD39674.1 Phage-related protein, tail component [Pantoea floridensis]